MRPSGAIPEFRLRRQIRSAQRLYEHSAIGSPDDFEGTVHGTLVGAPRGALSTVLSEEGDRPQKAVSTAIPLEADALDIVADKPDFSRGARPPQAIDLLHRPVNSAQRDLVAVTDPALPLTPAGRLRRQATPVRFSGAPTAQAQGATISSRAGRHT